MGNALADLLQAEGFRAGLVMGLLAGVVLVLVRASRQTVVPWGGLAALVATLLALTTEAEVPDSLVLALALLGAGGYAARDAHRFVRVAAALPGAIVLAAATDVPGSEWAAPAVLLATAVGAALVADFDHVAAGSGLPLVLIAVTTLGIYLCGPETQQSVVVVGVSLPLVLLGWPVPMASLGPPGACAMTGLVTWLAVTAGSARPGAVVGGIACLGVLVLEPAVAWLQGCHAVSPGRALVPRLVAVAAVHAAGVGVSARVAGLRESAADALGIVVVAFAAGAVVIAGLGLLAGAHSRER